jgi:iron(III) transport system substrate-binding protein
MKPEKTMKNLISLWSIFFILLLVIGCDQETSKEVVIYTSVDQIFSEPILSDFEKNTGIKVKAVYDVEASKTVGLVNRLLAENDHPRCDVFWNSEVGRTIFLKQKGLFTPYTSPSAKDISLQFKDKDGYWTGFAARARVLVYNINLLKESDLPKSIFELTKPRWKGKLAMGYPVFGTTATHMAALYATLGQEKTETFLKALKANKVVIVDGNSVVRDMVVEGQLPIGFTDTDDVNVAIQAGKPVKMIYPDRDGLGTLLIPNTVALINHAPHLEEGKKLIDYLLSREVESKLAFCESAQMPVRDGVKTPPHVPIFSSIRAMKVDYYDIAENIGKSDRFCQSLFIR